MTSPLVFVPVAGARWRDFETLFDGPGGPKTCWCMVWRATPEETRDSKGPARKRQLRSRIDAGATIGLLGYREAAPVAWVSVAARDSYRRLGGPQAEPGDTIWSLACMYLRREIRGQGYGEALIEAAAGYARARGATILEAYPVDPDSPSYRFMGFVPAFERLGFRHVGEAGSRRHVMRLALD